MLSNRKIILIIILLASISVSAYFILIIIPARLAERSYQAARKVSHDIQEAFQFTPEITVNHTIIVQQQSPVLELATLSQKFHHEYQWTSQWMGSTKKINVSGTFEAKAGFNLSESFSISFDDKKAIVSLPPPQMLSVESLGNIKFEDEHGIWNWIDEADRSAAINAFTMDARKYAEQSHFVNDSEKVMQQKLKEILLNHVTEVEFHASEIKLKKN